jgi:ABC-type amino acid transport substrate-binding protein
MFMLKTKTAAYKSVLLGVFFGVCSAVVSAEEYLVHTGPNGYPPFMFVHEHAGNKSYSGIVVDLLDAFEEANPEFSRSYNAMSRARTNLHIKRGEFSDLMFFSPLFASEDTKKKYRFTEELFVSQDIVVTQRDSGLDYKEHTDLYGKDVAVLRGYSYGEFDLLFKKGLVTPIEVDRHTQAVGMLSKGRVDAYFGNIHVTPFYMKQVGLAKNEFNFSDAAMFEVEYAFMIHNKKSKLYNALNQFIAEQKSNGKLQRIIDSYIQ